MYCSDGFPLVGSRSFEVKSYLHLIGIKVVVYQGVIREKPTTEEEARQFIRGLSLNSYQKFPSYILANSSSHVALQTILVVLPKLWDQYL